MRKHDHTLLDEIQRDVLSGPASIADTLRKLIALGGQAGSTELREWASRELRGYIGSGEDLPEYRKPGAVIKIDATTFNTRITGQQISPRSLPDFVQDAVAEEVPLAHPIGEIEAMVTRAQADGGSINLTLPGAQDIASIMNHEVDDPYQQITAIYWTVGASSLQGVIDQVKTTLVELLAEMRAGMADTADVPTAAVADQAVSVVVHGRGARVNVTSARVTGSGGNAMHASSVPDAGHSMWRKVGGVIVGLATIAAAVIALAQWQGWGI